MASNCSRVSSPAAYRRCRIPNAVSRSGCRGRPTSWRTAPASPPHHNEPPDHDHHDPPPSDTPSPSPDPYQRAPTAGTSSSSPHRPHLLASGPKGPQRPLSRPPPGYPSPATLPWRAREESVKLRARRTGVPEGGAAVRAPLFRHFSPARSLWMCIIVAAAAGTRVFEVLSEQVNDRRK